MNEAYGLNTQGYSGRYYTAITNSNQLYTCTHFQSIMIQFTLEFKSKKNHLILKQINEISDFYYHWWFILRFINSRLQKFKFQKSFGVLPNYVKYPNFYRIPSRNVRNLHIYHQQLGKPWVDQQVIDFNGFFTLLP